MEPSRRPGVVFDCNVFLQALANAAYLVSRDQDLLDLVTTSTDVARQFRSRYPFLRIMKAADFITEMEDRAARSES